MFLWVSQTPGPPLFITGDELSDAKLWLRAEQLTPAVKLCQRLLSDLCSCIRPLDHLICRAGRLECKALWTQTCKNNSDERASWIFQHAAQWLRRRFMIIADIAVENRFIPLKAIDSTCRCTSGLSLSHCKYYDNCFYGFSICTQIKEVCSCTIKQ